MLSATSPSSGKTKTRGMPGLRFSRLFLPIVLLLLAPILLTSSAPKQQSAGQGDTEPKPEAAIPAILGAFDKYEVVAMPEDHGLKDLDDFIFSLIRNPVFSEKANDIVIECGNSAYQPLLDRYIAGEDVPLAEARKVWRNTSQPICGTSGFGFFEQLYPLIRAINLKLPPQRRFRALAADPPIDWGQVKSFDDILKLGSRDASIASVMEKEVLSKHRRALMLFGTFHLLHMSDVRASAVSMYEKDYPGVTFVISELTAADKGVAARSASWPIPSVVRAQGTSIGALNFGHFFPLPLRIDQDCKVRNDLPKHLQKPIEDLVDAFLYLGPNDLALKEQLPAYIVLDEEYMAEVRRRESVLSGLGSQKDFYQQFVNDAEDPLFTLSKPLGAQEVQAAVESCVERKGRSSAPKAGTKQVQ